MAVQPEMAVPGEVAEEVSGDVDGTPSHSKSLRDISPAELFAAVNSLAEKMDGVLEDMDTLRKKQEWMGRRQEEAENTRRGQLDCVSERLYNAEKELRQVQKMQEDAVEKASAAFQKHANEVLQDRQHMTNAISQVNQNFEQVSSEMVQNSAIVKGAQNLMNQVEADMSQFSYNLMSYSNTTVALQQDVGSLHATAQEQHQQIQELHLALQAVHDTMTHMTPQTQFLEADSRQRMLSQQLADLQDQVAEIVHEHMQAQRAPSSASPPPAARDSRLPSAQDSRRTSSNTPWLDEWPFGAPGPGGGLQEHSGFAEMGLPLAAKGNHGSGVVFGHDGRQDHRPPLDHLGPRTVSEAQRGEGGCGRYTGLAEDELPRDAWAWPPELRRAYENAHGKRSDEDELPSRPAARRSERVAFTTSIHDVPRVHSGFERRGSENL